MYNCKHGPNIVFYKASHNYSLKQMKYEKIMVMFTNFHWSSLVGVS